ncbi:MAG: Holliday junction branch migration protein RuvA [Sphaerobacteraceae bacterium]|nr:MAG: Holliday junction branch migration protein RuvA [Sphaerobacteraceae bacterium]
MISGIRGTLLSKLPGILHVDVGGIFIRVLTSQHSVDNAPDPGTEVTLTTHLQVREDDLTLFGFVGQDELQCFQLLIGVNGIGPRVALGMLSASRPDDIYQAIAAEDATYLSRMPGIGKKTANRIIFDLRGKLPEPTEDEVSSSGPVSRRSDDMDALEALQALGYSAAEGRDALSRIDSSEGETVEERVFNALRILAPSS